MIPETARRFPHLRPSRCRRTTRIRSIVGGTALALLRTVTVDTHLLDGLRRPDPLNEPGGMTADTTGDEGAREGVTDQMKEGAEICLKKKKQITRFIETKTYFVIESFCLGCLKFILSVSNLIYDYDYDRGNDRGGPGGRGWYGDERLHARHVNRPQGNRERAFFFLFLIFLNLIRNQVYASRTSYVL